MEEEPMVVYAEDGEEFQEYVDNKGKRIPAGEPIGVEIGNELILFDDVNYLNY